MKKIEKIRVGIIGAPDETSWSANSHLPALAALPGFEVIAVCTRRAESAEKARTAYKARYAFTDSAALAASSDVDLVVVTVSAPGHYEA